MNEGKIESGDSELMAYQFFGALCTAAVYESIHIEKIDLDNIIRKTVEFTLKGLGIQM